MRRRSELNVLQQGYLPKGRLRNWPYNFIQFFRNIRYAYQRVTRGWCDRDVWSLDCYLSELVAETVNHLSKTTHSYPGRGDMNTPAKWKDCLREIVLHCYNSQEDNDFTDMNVEVRELWEAYDALRGTDREQEACNRWLAKEEEAALYREAEKDIAFDMLKKHFFDLWD